MFTIKIGSKWIKTKTHHGSTDDEVATRVDVILGLAIEIFLRNDLLDDLFHDVLAELLEGDLLAVLEVKFWTTKLKYFHKEIVVR